jgi:DNA repair exonuclease SbcCD ATPase subunit
MPSELEIIVQQLYQATEELKKLREDIQVANAERSNLQNSIQADKDKARGEVGKECAQLKSDTKIECDRLIAEAKDRVISAKIKEDSATVKEATVSEILVQVKLKESETIQDRVDFESYKTAELSKIKGNQDHIYNSLNAIDLRNKDLDSELESLKKAKYSLDNREFNLNEQADNLKSQTLEIGVLLEKNNSVLNDIQKVREAIRVEKDDLQKILLEIKDQQLELEKMGSVKDDLKKLAEEQSKLVSQQNSLTEESKQLATKQEKLREQELTNSENLRLIQVESRKNDVKLETIKKLREENIKNA